MWESVERLVNSGQMWFVLICIACMIICVKAGILRYKSDKILFGKDIGERERSILKNQIEYSYRMCQGFFNQVPRFDGFDEFQAKYIIELCYDEIVKWIYFNHIETKNGYIENKQDIIWSIIQMNVTHKKLTSKQFRATVDDYVRHVIEHLVSIREEYDK